ncbi:hypothetical protein TI05_11250 [Achromatium sp. WMS3]|nr:hypothetical protein TI05_11250 [Achromatium sp. WMS3]
MSIVLIRREGVKWNEDQRRWLADGLRHTNAGHLLIEFKYTEGLTISALSQLIAYDYFYCKVGKRPLKDVACFLIIARTPNGAWYKNYGFTPTKWSGVYQGIETNNKRIKILLLNELKPTPHNAALKCFATRRKQQDAAFQLMDSSGLENLSTSLEKFTLGLRRIFMPHTLPAEGWTPDKVMDLGQAVMDAALKAAPIEKILSYHKPDEILSHYQPSEVLSHYQPSEVLSHYQPSEILRYYHPEQFLATLTEEQIRAYLEKIKKS